MFQVLSASVLRHHQRKKLWLSSDQTLYEGTSTQSPLKSIGVQSISNFSSRSKQTSYIQRPIFFLQIYLFKIKKGYDIKKEIRRNVEVRMKTKKFNSALKLMTTNIHERRFKTFNKQLSEKIVNRNVLKIAQNCTVVRNL